MRTRILLRFFAVLSALSGLAFVVVHAGCTSAPRAEPQSQPAATVNAPRPNPYAHDPATDDPLAPAPVSANGGGTMRPMPYFPATKAAPVFVPADPPPQAMQQQAVSPKQRGK
jgi:hypothetical protein